jgi:hypothetical protein
LEGNFVIVNISPNYEKIAPDSDEDEYQVFLSTVDQ